MPVFHLIAAAAASVLLYAGAFTSVLKLPLTSGLTESYYQAKRAYARQATGRKIVLYAGSNGLFSHRCETIEQALGVPCVNASLHAGLALDMAFESLKPMLAPGDLLLLPLEYSQYVQTDKDLGGGGESSSFVLPYHPEWLRGKPLRQIAGTLLSFDLRYLASSIVENGLDLAGVQRRFTAESITPNGDMRGHTRVKGLAYREYVNGLHQAEPPVGFETSTYAGERVLAEFLRWCRGRSVTAVGLLPTVFDDHPVREGTVAVLRALYEAEGARFMVLPGGSQYPRECFYDTHYHLDEECQVRHSAAISEAIAGLVGRS